MDQELRTVADELHAAAACLAGSIPVEVLEDCFWDFEDEDWVRDLILAGERYARWRETGESPFLYLAEGLDPGVQLADDIAYRAWRVFGVDTGWPVPQGAKRELGAALEAYKAARGSGWRFGF